MTQSPASSSNIGHAGSRGTALVVEDDPHIADLVCFLLQRENYEVRLQRDGRAAREFIHTQPPPRLVLMDVMLPFVDGIELLSALRAEPGWSEVPVIMLTARSQDHHVVRALEAGANDYVPKPFSPDELLARVRRLARP